MAAVRTGLDVLLERRLALVRGRRVGLVAHQASVTARLEHAALLLRHARGVRVVRLFAPEHGLWGAAQDHARVRATRDPATGLAVASLYGERRAPTTAMLRDLDVVVIDLQDVGARYYTFSWTMALVLRACERTGVAAIVLDRPNPLGGDVVEGNLPERAFASFVGLVPLPARHGLTVAEIARHLALAHGIRPRLEVVPMRGWGRAMRWEDTELPWVAPSPNMPTVDTARVYPGGCLIEGTNLSEGRGTTRPFEWVGAPYLDPHRLAARLEAQQLPGARFRPTRFTPTFHKWAGRLCGGVQIHVTDERRFKPFLTGLAVIVAARAEAKGAFRWRQPPYEFERRKLPIDILLGTDALRRALERGRPLRALERGWQGELGRWRRRRAGALLYE